MDDQERSRHINRIVAAQSRCRIGGSIFLLGSPTRIQRCYADDIYDDRLVEARCAGAYSEEELSGFLSGHGIWTVQDEENFALIAKNIEDQKVGLFEYLGRSQKRQTIREALAIAKKEQMRMLVLKHSHDHISAHGIAFQAKTRYLLGCAVKLSDGSPYWEDEDEGWKTSDKFLEDIYAYQNKFRVSEADMRELARTDPWRSLWNARKYCGKGVFDQSSVDLTDDQRSLVAWSSTYDSVQEFPDCPADEVMEDDDVFDGWMIIKRRARDAEKAQKFGDESISNERIKNSSEIFMVAESREDAKRIIDSNSGEAKMLLQQRMNTVMTKGTVAEGDMPDSILQKQQQAMQRFSNHIKKG